MIFDSRQNFKKHNLLWKGEPQKIWFFGTKKKYQKTYILVQE